jgi:hypothetical protein
MGLSSPGALVSLEKDQQKVKWAKLQSDCFLCGSFLLHV